LVLCITSPSLAEVVLAVNLTDVLGSALRRQ
jgi:hypothetical protein